MRIFAKAGERVTRENGEHIATVLRDLAVGDMPKLADLEWAVAPPATGSTIAPYTPGSGWVRSNHAGSCDLHLARGWASETVPA